MVVSVVRAFAALALPDGHRELLAAYLDRCRALAPGFRWVQAESLHLTLRFLGAVDEERLAAVRGRLAEVRASPFEARLDGTGTFGGRRRASVVWLALVEGVAATAELSAACERACQEAGLEPEPRTFRPHVTLARARSRSGEPLGELPPAPELPAWTVDGFVLYESRLRGGSPPEYVPIEIYGFAG